MENSKLQQNHSDAARVPWSLLHARESDPEVLHTVGEIPLQSTLEENPRGFINGF